MKKLILLLSLFYVTGCGGMAAKQATTNALLSVDSGSKLDDSGLPECQVAYDDYQLDTHIAAFELVSKTGIGFGFNLLSGFFRALGLDVKIEKGQMVSYMTLSETIQPTEPIASVEGKGTSTKTDFNVSIDITKLGADVSYFSQTPLSTLSSKTVRNNLTNLKSELDSANIDWKSKIVYAKDGDLIIPVGRVSGVRPGDTFKIYNVEYIWEGAPCGSKLLLERKTTAEELAIGEAVQVEGNATLLRVLVLNSDEPIKVGARVEIKALTGKDANKRKLSRPVHINEVTSEKLAIENNTNVDLTVYVTDQLRAYMDEYGLHPRN